MTYECTELALEVLKTVSVVVCHEAVEQTGFMSSAWLGIFLSSGITAIVGYLVWLFTQSKSSRDKTVLTCITQLDKCRTHLIRLNQITKKDAFDYEGVTLRLDKIEIGMNNITTLTLLLARLRFVKKRKNINDKFIELEQLVTQIVLSYRSSTTKFPDEFKIEANKITEARRLIDSIIELLFSGWGSLNPNVAVTD